MINREITYERDINKSYMKIPSVVESCFDEKMLFQKNYSGCIPMEKCFVNGQGQYWYNITGKQALDAYCRVNQIGLSFFETLILRICNQLEVLEWNLIDVDCLMVDPELIFVNSKGEEISFVLYPSNSGNFFQDLQQLMEYLLTKLNHGEKEAVHAAYKIYEITLSEGYSMSDLKEAILKAKGKEERQEKPNNIEVSKRPSIPVSRREPSKAVMVHDKKDHQKERNEEKEHKKGTENPVKKIQNQMEKKWEEVIEKVKIFLSSKPEDFFGKKKDMVQRKEEVPIVVYPDEEETKQEMAIHPTVCLAMPFGQPRGILIYEGTGEYMDFDLEQSVCLIGKNHRARMRIERETISQFHAKIDFIDNTYYIEDLNSTNGTFVNDEILNYKERKVLQPGDVVRFADVKYRFL